jgi:hypothetical protein
MTNKLPPLPTEKAVFETGLGQIVTFSAKQYSEDQIQAYGQHCWEAAIKKAAQLCSIYEELCLREHGHTTTYGDIRADAAKSLAKEIRSLK